VHLNIGDVVPADIRLLHIEELSADESILTGESIPAVKETRAGKGRQAMPQHLKNVVFAGTSIASGLGYGMVIATGKDTVFNKTAAYLKQKEPEADFQKNINKFSNFLLKVILLMTLFVFAANALLGKGVFVSFLFAVALAVGITPEVLPVIMTITLSNGALKMAKEKVVTKRLASVEDFGNIDTLCCDKTGTLTEGKVALRKYVNLDEEQDDKLVVYGLLCNMAERGKGRKHYGNPIDKAVWEHQKARELEPSLRDFRVIHENEFDFERRRMSVVIESRKKRLLIVKGAAESVLSVCSQALIKNRCTKLSKDKALKISKNFIERYGKAGYTVIAVAEKKFSKTKSTNADEKYLCLLGFLLFLDPPKKTAPEALKLLQGLGVAIKVISGDHHLVTRKVCEEVGLKIAGNRVVTGEELECLSEAEFEDYSMKYNVFARVTPEQKHKIIASLNKEDHIVGFLGDGVNDVPALRAADVGISVDSAAGIAKEAADIILLHKSLRVLAHGIMEGRKTFGNITKYIFNTISANFGNMFTVAFSSLFLKFIPLLPSQILLNNFISDVPQLTISTDNVDEEFTKKPKRWNIKLISRFMVYFGLISSFFDLALIALLIFVLNTGTELFRTAWFLESVLSEIIVTFAIRTRLPFYKSMPSKWLLLVSIAAILASIAITYTLFGQTFFSFVSMPASVLAIIFIVLVAYFFTAEIAKKHFFEKFKI
jgi:Mg2+-importing ATPase